MPDCLSFLTVGVFEEGRYWDIFAEYSKNTPEDLLIKITVANRGPETARVHVLPTLWFRNTWSWGCDHEACTCGTEPEECMTKPKLIQTQPGVVACHHDTLGKYIFTVDSGQEGHPPEVIFTENETNFKVRFGARRYERNNRLTKTNWFYEALCCLSFHVRSY